MCISSMPPRGYCAVWQDVQPSIGHVTRLTALWSCSTIVLRYCTCRMMLIVPTGMLYGSVVEYIDMSVEEMQRILVRLVG
jgi:hypothetical protein